MQEPRKSTATLLAGALAMAVAGATGFMIALRAVPPAPGNALSAPASPDAPRS